MLNIKKYKLIIIITLLFASSNLHANFDFNINCQNTYQNIFTLKLATAKYYLNIEKKENPQNSFIPLLENYIDYFYLLTNENKTEFTRLSNLKSNRLSQLAKGDKHSPFYLYAQAEVNLQWALIRGRYGEYFAASREINKADNLLKENQKKFPNFILNQKGLALINVTIGSLPDGFMKSTLSTFGVKGSVQTGLAMMNNLVEKLPNTAYKAFYDEVVFYYAYILADVAKTEDALPKTLKYTAKMPDSSLLKSYLQAYINIRRGKNDEAIKVLINRPQGRMYQPFAYLDYLNGIARLNQLNLQASTQNFNLFLQHNKGSNYIKDTYLHLAWIALLKNDSSLYQTYINKTKDSGNTYAYQDKQALNEASELTPNVDLLKARLLWDGGYYDKVLSMLENKNIRNFKTPKEQTEYHYRLARTYDELGKKDLALNHYQLAINLGRNLKYYFASKSAVLMGNIYAETKDFQKARNAYQTAINMKGHEYEDSIENEAKQGIKHIGG